MTSTDFRIASDVRWARRALREFPVPRASNVAAKLGLRYERSVVRELQRHVVNDKFLRLEHNPWFTFSDSFGTSNCCPDVVLWASDNQVLIVEVKLTWVDVAIEKLTDLYCPVVAQALQCYVMPLVICRNITPHAPPPAFKLSEAISSAERLLQWPNTGHIAW